MRHPFRVSIAVVALALPATSIAQSGDAAYCKAMADKFQRCAGARDFGRGSPPPNAAISEASAACGSNPAAAIPVLEKALEDARIDLPPRS